MKSDHCTNLLTETTGFLARVGKTPADVRWVGVRRAEYEKRPPISFSWGEFAALAGFTYDAGFGGAEIAGGLVVVGEDWWLERGEYDGSEWWEFKTLPTKPAYATPCVGDLTTSY